MDHRILEKRDRINEIAGKYGALKIRIFGSQLRGEEHVDSDIDLLVEFEAQCLQALTSYPVLSSEMRSASFGLPCSAKSIIKELN